MPVAFPSDVADPLRAGGKDAGHAFTAAEHGDSLIPVAFGGNRTSGPIEVATACRAHGRFHSDFETETFLVSSGPAADEVANLVAFPMRGREGGAAPEPAEEGIANALRTPGGGSSHQFVAFSAKDHGADAGEEVSPTLRAMNGEHANAGGQVAIAFHARQDPISTPGITPPLDTDGTSIGIALPFDSTQITHQENRSDPPPGDPCHTLPQSGHPPSVAFTLHAESSNAKRTAGFEAEVARGLDTCGGYSHNQGGNLVAGGYRVRRLTPRECERLQGVPDDFTLVPYRRGAPMADGPRYKMIGNSQAANVMRWLGHGIAEVEAQLRAAGLVE